MLGKMLGMQKGVLGREPTGNQIIVTQYDSALAMSKAQGLMEAPKRGPHSHRNALVSRCREVMLSPFFHLPERLPCFRHCAGAGCKR